MLQLTRVDHFSVAGEAQQTLISRAILTPMCRSTNMPSYHGEAK